MDREDAIQYLDRHGKINGETKYNSEEEAEIDKVMKSGKIYGDPVVELY